MNKARLIENDKMGMLHRSVYSKLIFQGYTSENDN